MSDLSAGCFGKLPIYPDFIRHNATNTEVSQLDQWFQEGIQFSKLRLGQEWPETFSRAESWNFLFYPDHARHFLLGVYGPSRDQGGRLYPFFIFLRIEYAPSQLPLYFAPSYFSSFLNKARGILQNGWKDMDLKTFISGIGAIELNMDENIAETRERYLHYLRENTSREFWTGLFGDFSHAGKYLVIRNLADILGALRQNPENKFGLGLKFPLMPQPDGETFDIPFWFDMILRSLRHDRLSPVFFWNRNPTLGKPCMLTFLSQPSPKGFLFLMNPDMDSDYWYDLAPENMKEIDRVLNIIEKDQKELLDNETLLLTSFLEAIETFG